MSFRKGKTLEDLQEQRYQKIGEDAKILFKVDNRIKIYSGNNKGEYELLLGFKKRKYWQN